jgi:DNA polymerase-3 subunit alpha
MSNNYLVYHLHSDFSNCITNIDSATKVEMYVQKAKELGMNALALSEHGSFLNWYEKKKQIESAGLKYIHAIECYITATLQEKIRDNYHCILIAKNYDGFIELNRLISKSFNRSDGHFYYVPRISIDELCSTSNNIFITTACISGVFKSENTELKNRYVEFLSINRDRCFLEIQHHNVPEQKIYNQKMLELHNQYEIKLITGTDTHSLNEEIAEARIILQKAKNIRFDNEDGWDLTFKSYDELVKSFVRQNCLSEEIYLQAIENTNIIADQIETFVIDCSPKYPKLYDNPNDTFKNKIQDRLISHPYVLKNHTKDEIDTRVFEEVDIYDKTASVDFMLLQSYIRDWEHENGIYCGYSRGSVSGSEVAYILGISEMDSIKFDLNFFRFMNPSRITNADIDTDYSNKDRDKVREFLLSGIYSKFPNFRSCEIVAFNTIAMKGAIRDVGRALGMPLTEVDPISKNIEELEVESRKKYPELFKFVDLLSGVIVSVGTHPAGVLLADIPIDETLGLFSLGTTPYPVSCIDMYGLDAMFYTKLDILGLDNIGVINETCKLAGIERVNPDNIDLDDWEVWKDIREDTTGIFQWESSFALITLRELFSDSTIAKIRKRNPNMSYLKLFSFGNGLIRPGCASFRTNAAKGEFYDNGLKEINDMLSQTLGYVSMQEDIMRFLTMFCGYSMAESDLVRRGIAKKKGTEKLLPEIESRFISYTSEKYGVSKEKCADIIKPFLQVVLDSSAYAFSWNHSDSYSFIGYACGWLRHYYPIEFITSCLNTWKDNEDKTANVVKYADTHKIKILNAKFRHSKAEYFYNKETNCIYKGMQSIKYLNEDCSNQLYGLRNNKYDRFSDLLKEVVSLNINSRQLEILIKLNYFIEFGNPSTLLRIVELFDKLKQGEAKQISKDSVEDEVINNIIKRHSRETKKKYVDLDVNEIFKECEDYIISLNLEDYTIKQYIAIQSEYLGYFNLTTNKEEDRRRLLIQNLMPLKSPQNGAIWAYSFNATSIGSGVKSHWTIKARLYNLNPFCAMDIIYAEKVHKEKEKYWYLDKYNIEK